jgi:hypothetical protein
MCGTKPKEETQRRRIGGEAPRGKEFDESIIDNRIASFAFPKHYLQYIQHLCRSG